MGYGTMEQCLMSTETQEFVTIDPGTYKIPTIADIPRYVNV